MLSRFHRILERNGQTDGQTDRIAISISRVSMLTRDKKPKGRVLKFAKHHSPSGANNVTVKDALELQIQQVHVAGHLRPRPLQGAATWRMYDPTAISRQH